MQTNELLTFTQCKESQDNFQDNSRDNFQDNFFHQYQAPDFCNSRSQTSRTKISGEQGGNGGSLRLSIAAIVI